MSDKTKTTDQATESEEVIQSRESVSIPARVEGRDEQGRVKLLRLYYDEEPKLERPVHKVVSVRLEGE